jgi:RecA/RadA recombinase
MGKAVIIYGPQGCGKTTRADDMKAYFKAQRVVDLDELGVRPYIGGRKREQPIVPAGTVALTCDEGLAREAAERSNGEAWDFKDFLRKAGLEEKHAAHIKRLRGGA